MKRIQVVSIQMVKEKSFMYDYVSKAIGSPEDAARMFHQFMFGADREKFVIAGINTKNEVNFLNVIHVGSVNASIIHPREVFKPAILSNCASVILCHNHPSGDPTPSREDIEVTKRLQEAGRIIGIEVLDHVIIGLDGSSSFYDTKHVSLKEKGYL